MAAQLSTKLTLDGSQHNDAIRNATKEVSKYKREVDSANKQINNMKKELNGVTSGINSMFNSIKTGNFSGMYEGAASATGALKNLIPMMGATATGATAMGASITAALGPIGLAVAAIAAMGAVTVKAASSYEKYNTALLDLSALTGVTGDELDAVGDIATGMSVKFGTSAEDIINSMKNIGSQAPQLLSDMNSLSAVTESAMVLSKASGMIVEDTSKAITTIMNQMDVDASKTSEIINSMAAGSKYGAADVQYLTTAFEKCGTQAKGAGMSFQQVIAAVETIAPKFKSADDAGQKLNGVLRNLQTQANDKFNPAIVGINAALENLSNANLSLAEKQKLVGAEGLTVLEVMTSNRQAFEDMTNKVTGTNVAYDQMNIKSNTLKATFDKLTQTINVLFIEIGKTFIVQAFISILTSLCKIAIKVIGFVNDLIKVINALWKAFKDTTGVKNFIRMFNRVKDAILNVINVISKQWNRFLKSLGVDAKVNVKTEIEEDKKENKKEDKKENKKENNTNNINTNAHNFVTKRIKDSEVKNVKLIEDPLIVELNNNIKRLSDSFDKSLKDAEGKTDLIKDVLEIGYDKFDSQTDEFSKKLKVVVDARELIAELDKKLESNAYNKVDENGKKYFDYIEFNKDIITKHKVIDIFEKYSSQLEDLRNGANDEFEEGIKQEVKEKIYYKPTDYERAINKKEVFDSYERAINKKEVFDSYEHAINKKEVFDSYEHAINKKEVFDSIKQEMDYNEKLYKNIEELLVKYKKYLDGIPEENQNPVVKEKIAELGRIKNFVKNRQAVLGEQARKEYKTQQREENYNKFVGKSNDITGAFYGIDSVVGSFENLTNAIEEGANAWEVFMGILQTFNSILGAVGDTMKAITTIQEILGVTTQETSAIQSAATAEDTANTAIEVANSTTKTAAKSGEAVAEATASGAKMPFPYNLIAIAAGIAAVVGALSLIGSFADGGIIQGRSTIGDHNLARVNGGEMILNTRQQNNLFRAINENRLGSNGSVVGGTIKIKGSDLYVALKNYGSTKSKVGKNIGIR